MNAPITKPTIDTTLLSATTQEETLLIQPILPGMLIYDKQAFDKKVQELLEAYETNKPTGIYF